eukprot:m.355285 g.355285  ORF g.355285 m.355285 type:complete len:211 (-) comp17211_c0_seq1:272-904(-)
MSQPAASIALHAVVFPALAKVEEADPSMAAALHSIQHALEMCESANPGVTHELVDYILEKEQAKGGADITERLLRAAANDIDCYTVEGSTPEIQLLSSKASALKLILSRIPDEVANRTTFLGIIRQIADAIKEMLDAINAVASNNADLIADHASTLQQQRKAFVRGSKSFSDTLKQYFKDNKLDNLFRSAHRLINKTNSLMRTIKDATSK